MSDAVIAACVSVSEATVCRTGRRFVEGNLEPTQRYAKLGLLLRLYTRRRGSIWKLPRWCFIYRLLPYSPRRDGWGKE